MNISSAVLSALIAASVPIVCSLEKEPVLISVQEICEFWAISSQTINLQDFFFGKSAVNVMSS